MKKSFRRLILFFKEGDFALISILCLGFFTHVLRISSKSLWCDEAWSICFIQKSWDTIFSHHYSLFPVYFILLKIWSTIFGYSEISLRMLSVIFGTLSIYLIYRLGEMLFSRRTGLVAALLLSLSTYHVIRSQQIRYYTLLLFLVLTILIYFKKIISKNKVKDHVFYGLLTVLMFYTNCFAATLMFALNNIFYLFYKNKSKNWWMTQGAVLICFSLILLPFSTYYPRIIEHDKYAPLIYGPRVISNILEDFSYGKYISQRDFSTYLQAQRPFSTKILLHIFLFIIAYSFLRFIIIDWKKSRKVKSDLIFIVLWMVFYFGLLTFLSSFFVFDKLSKAAICILPAFYLVIAHCICKFKKRIRFFLIILIITFSVNSLSYNYFPPTLRSWREIASFIKANIKQDELIVLAPLAQLATFWYYYDPSYKQLENIANGWGGRGMLINNVWYSKFTYKNNLIVGIGFDKVGEFLDDYFSSHDKPEVVWLIITPGWMGIDSTLQLKNGISNYYVVNKLNKYLFEGIEIYRYSLKNR